MQSFTDGGYNMSKEDKYVVVVSIDGMANYYLNDPKVKMPVLREIIRSGATAEAMVSIAPTATWAIHTSIVTGTYPRKHGVLGNWVFDRPNRRVGEHFGERMWSKAESVLCPTLYDEAKSRGWTTAAICWPRTREADTLDWNIPECYDQELFEQYSTPEFWQELKDAGLPVDCYAAWSKDHGRGAMQDWLTNEIAKHLIINHQPNLLMLHYLLPDSLQHDYGTCTNEVYWSLEYVDERIGELIGTLKKAGIWDNTDLFIMSDHGFVDTTKTLFPNVLFKQKGWFNEADPSQSKVITGSNGGLGYVYVLEEDAANRDLLLAEVRLLLAKTSGIGIVFERHQFADLGLPAEGEMDHHTPDFIFEAELDVFIHFDPSGEEVMTHQSKFSGMHGYLPHHEKMKAIFAATGKSIQPGTKLGEIHLVDIAPTIMRIIGGELPDADGQALDEIWKDGVVK
jgi:predicted AlkP superfamily pyrophosphatase or phosphodiesterase